MFMEGDEGFMNHDLGGGFNRFETNRAPENQWFEDVFPFGMAYFQVLC